MTKEEVAGMLGVSVRAVERYTAQNKLAVVYEKGRSKPHPVYSEEAVLAFKESLNQPTHRPVPETPGNNTLTVAPSQPDSSLAVSKLATALQLVLESQSAKATAADEVRIAERPILKLRQASLLTGISAERLKAAIESGNLNGVKDGEWGRGWRIRRADLDRFIAAT